VKGGYMEIDTKKLNDVLTKYIEQKNDIAVKLELIQMQMFITDYLKHLLDEQINEMAKQYELENACYGEELL
jgi:hypothetical protein